jgi:REP element-mobilizing transposase RayT
MRSKYKIYDKNAIYFITSTIVEWIPVFTSKPYFDILKSSIEFCQLNKNLSIYAYVLLDNHFHIVCDAPELQLVIQSLKRHTAIKIIERLEMDGKKWLLDLFSTHKKKYKNDSTHQIWQEGYHPQQMMSDVMMRQKMDYIHFNPVERGYVSEPEHWVYSSARDFMGIEKGFIKLKRIDML